MDYGRRINENIYQAQCYRNHLKITSALDKYFNTLNIIWGENPWDELGMKGSKKTVTIKTESNTSFAVGGETIVPSQIVKDEKVKWLGFGKINVGDYKDFDKIISFIEMGYLETEVETLPDSEENAYIFEVIEWNDGENIIYVVNKLGEIEY